MRLLVILGTRPEAIKLCPLIRHAQTHKDIDVRVCVTAQHRALLDQVLRIFEITPDFDLDIMQPGQSLYRTTARIIEGLEPVLSSAKPDVVAVQGDTTTTLAGALSAFYAHVPVAHIEAGLRTGDLREPFPEEMNRVVVTRLARYHFAATDAAAANLKNEGINQELIHVTGNTGIDAVLYVSDAIAAGRLAPAHNLPLDHSRKLVLVTAHRRESFGAGMLEIANAVRTLARRSDIQLVLPVHPNPNVAAVMRRELDRTPNVLLCEPLDYVSFVDVMRRAHIILTDSGGVQEEAPSLGKPVLVLRNKTERSEAVEAGTAVLVGSDQQRIVDESALLLDNPDEHRRRAVLHNPYGDGRASERICEALLA